MEEIAQIVYQRFKLGLKVGDLGKRPPAKKRKITAANGADNASEALAAIGEPPPSARSAAGGLNEAKGVSEQCAASIKVDMVNGPVVDGAIGEPLLSYVDTGTRIEVYWPIDDTFYPGIVTGRHLSESNVCVCTIQYDDGDEEVLDLAKETVRIHPDDMSRLRDAMKTLALGPEPSKLHYITTKLGMTREAIISSLPDELTNSIGDCCWVPWKGEPRPAFIISPFDISGEGGIAEAWTNAYQSCQKANAMSRMPYLLYWYETVRGRI